MHKLSIPFPAYGWPIAAASGSLTCVLKWRVFSFSAGRSGIIGAHMIRGALDHTFEVAGISALLTCNCPWQNTNKFPVMPAGLAALGAAAPELLLGDATLALSIAAICAGPATGLLALSGIGGLLKAAKYLFAPILVILAEQELHQRAKEFPRAAKT